MLLDYVKLHLFGIDLVFIDFKNYQNLIENFLESKKNELEQSFNEANLLLESKKNGEFANEYYNYLIDQYWERHQEISKIFPHNFRASFLIQVVSFIEFELKELCDHYASFKKQIFEMKDLQGNSDFDKAKVYLKKVGNVNFENLEPEFKFIDRCRLLRNRLIHNQGNILESDKELHDLVKKNASLTLKDSIIGESTLKSVMINDKELIDELLKSAESFFKKLLFEELKYSS